MIKNNIKQNITWTDWDRTDFTTPKLPLATETWANVTFLGGRVGDSYICN